MRAVPSPPPNLAELDGTLSAVPGTVSVWCGRVAANLTSAEPAYTRLPDETHYAASTMKVAVLAALYREVERGRLDLATPVPVLNDFESAARGAARFGCTRRHDSDDAVWQGLGHELPLGWLARRMITHSSNLATNLVLDAVGLAAVARVWSLVGARHSVVRRGIEDAAASAAGLTNLVTAGDLARLLGAIAADRLAGRDSCRAMLTVLLAQEHQVDLSAGLPPGVPIAHKNGWVTGVRHSAGVIYPPDAPPYLLAVCASTPLAVNRPDDAACRLLARIAAASWADRHRLGADWTNR